MNSQCITQQCLVYHQCLGCGVDMSLDHSRCNSIVLHNILYYNSKMAIGCIVHSCTCTSLVVQTEIERNCKKKVKLKTEIPSLQDRGRGSTRGCQGPRGRPENLTNNGPALAPTARPGALQPTCRLRGMAPRHPIQASGVCEFRANK